MTTTSTFRFWINWLIIANVIALVIGLLVAFWGNGPFFAPHNANTQTQFLADAQHIEGVQHMKNWLFGIIGGTIVGFHILMIGMAHYALRKKEKWAYLFLWLGLLLWFVIDSSISIFYGAAYNVYLINIPAFVMIGLPLIFLFRHVYSVTPE